MSRQFFGAAILVAALVAASCGDSGPKAKVGTQEWVDQAKVGTQEWSSRAGFRIFIIGIPSMRDCRTAVERHPNLTRAEINRNLDWCEEAFK